ncbi:MAG: hypothetical protein ACE5R4_13410 [Armatimonadota bacterium]
MQDFMSRLRIFLDRLRLGAKETTEAATTWAQRQNRIRVLRADIRQADAKKRDVYSLMGRKVYALHKKQKVVNKDLLALCEQVDEHNALMAEREEEIEQIKAEARAEGEVIIEDETPLGEEEPEPEAREQEELEEDEEEAEEAEEEEEEEEDSE